MDRPTTAVEAAAALERLSTYDALPFRVDYDLLADPAGSMRPSEIAARVDLVTRAAYSKAMVVPTLPPVLVKMDLFNEVGQTFIGRSGPPAISHEPKHVFGQTPHRNPDRYRTVVLAAPEESGVSPYDSRALVLSVGSARAAADGLARWAAVLPARATGRVEAEAAAYNAYAQLAESQIADSFGWADDLTADPPPEFHPKEGSSWI